MKCHLIEFELCNLIWIRLLRCILVFNFYSKAGSQTFARKNYDYLTIPSVIKSKWFKVNFNLHSAAFWVWVSVFYMLLPSLCLARYYNLLIDEWVNVTIRQKCCKRVARRSRHSCNIHKVSAPGYKFFFFFFGDQNFLYGDHFTIESRQKATFWKSELGALVCDITLAFNDTMISTCYSTIESKQVYMPYTLCNFDRFGDTCM